MLRNTQINKFDQSLIPCCATLQSKVRADDRWEEYSIVVAPPRPAVIPSISSKEPPRAHSKKSQPDQDNTPGLSAALDSKPDKRAHISSTAQNGSRGHSEVASAMVDKRQEQSSIPLGASQQQQEMGSSPTALDSIIHRFVLCSLFSILFVPCYVNIVLSQQLVGWVKCLGFRSSFFAFVELNRFRVWCIGSESLEEQGGLDGRDIVWILITMPLLWKYFWSLLLLTEHYSRLAVARCTVQFLMLIRALWPDEKGANELSNNQKMPPWHK